MFFWLLIFLLSRRNAFPRWLLYEILTMVCEKEETEIGWNSRLKQRQMCVYVKVDSTEMIKSKRNEKKNAMELMEDVP